MKIKTRRCMFETNSSSTHTITIMMKEDYDRWCDEELYLYKGIGSDYIWSDHHRPITNKVYTKEEVIEFIMNSKYPPKESFDFEDEDLMDELFRENGFYTAGYEDDYLEQYWEEFTTPNGETIVVFGDYGYDA